MGCTQIFRCHIWWADGMTTNGLYTNFRCAFDSLSYWMTGCGKLSCRSLIWLRCCRKLFRLRLIALSD